MGKKKFERLMFYSCNIRIKYIVLILKLQFLFLNAIAYIEKDIRFLFTALTI